MSDILYGAFGAAATTSDLYTIDPATGTPTAIGPIGFAMTGLAFDPSDGTLWGATSNNSAAHPGSLITVDPVTGAGTFVGTFSDTLSDLACDSSGNLYGYTATTPRKLASVDKATAALTLIGASAIEGPLDFVDDVLYAVSNRNPSHVYTVDPSTGVQTLVSTVTGFHFPGAISWNGTTMFVADTNFSGTLWTVDLNSGAGIFIGNVPGPSGKIDAIAWFIEPPPPFTGLVLADLPVRMFVTSIDGETISLLDHRATQRQFLFRLNAPAYTTGQVASDDNEINLPWPDPDSPASLTNNRRLLFALQRWKGATPPYQPIFGGIITTPEDQGSDAPTTRYTASDPWQYLMSRPIRSSDLGLPDIDGLKFPDQSRASDIALELLQLTDLVDGETHIDFSDTGLIADSTPLDGGITFDRSLSVGEAWTQLCDTGTIDIHLDPIYDPHGRPTKCVELRIVAQTEGTAAGPVLYDLVMSWDGPGHSLMGIKVLYFAGQGGVPAPLQQDAASIAAYGQYWSQQSFPGSHDRTTIALLALTELLIRRDGARSIQFDPAPERVEQPFKDYNLGDYLPVWASRNLREPLGVDYDAFDPDNPGASGYQRIYAIPMDVDDNGVTRVTGLITSKEN